MTEAGPVLSMCLAFAKHPFPTKSGSCGTVIRNAELKVIHPDTGSSLGYNQPGEICVRGQQIMKGLSACVINGRERLSVKDGFITANPVAATKMQF